MNPQLKKGFVEVCVLASINNEPSYGYKIINDLSSILELSESTLYPILRRLETNKQLTTFTRDYNGRLRKYYQITYEGKKRINEFKSEWQEMEGLYHFILEKGNKYEKE